MSSYVYNTACIYVHSIGSKYIYRNKRRSPIRVCQTVHFVSLHLFISTPLSCRHHEPLEPCNPPVQVQPQAPRAATWCDISATELVVAIDADSAGCLSCLSCLAPGHPCHPFRETDGVVEGSLPKKIHSKASLCIFQKMEKKTPCFYVLYVLSVLSFGKDRWHRCYSEDCSMKLKESPNRSRTAAQA